MKKETAKTTQSISQTFFFCFPKERKRKGTLGKIDSKMSEVSQCVTVHQRFAHDAHHVFPTTVQLHETTKTLLFFWKQQQQGTGVDAMKDKSGGETTNVKQQRALTKMGVEGHLGQPQGCYFPPFLSLPAVCSLQNAP